MENVMSMVQTGLKAVFWFLIPGAVVYFRYKKKITTGFAAGLIVTSFFLGLFASATVQEARTDPVDEFIAEMNDNTGEAKKALKILVQYGPEYLEKVDETKIIYIDRFKQIKQELIVEYEEIAREYYATYSVDGEVDCGKYITQKNNFGYLLHAMKLIEYSESLGGKHDVFKKNLKEKIDRLRPVIDQYEEQCD